ncbi:DODA-type extradiol aromatic ring-opening family dioxygenase [Leptothoe spongobia]|uniref:Dioxygenase n=1 Tax=Leptothoe spongobia TAU-MAC 1115 TaxID=1967444 RepID=A0A947DGA8_9CYAN|nr:class III extradiol ring-cleavage dioxygenase [Leptothoe spongobia]MBT9316523.1 dioxygenase [Leptothoe spongobia TAU-MAC 1115]
MPSLPSLFISHGAPDLPIRTGPTQTFLKELASTIPIPRAILIISAHWLTNEPSISTDKQPETVYDFGGFTPELYQLNYPAPGEPALAKRVAELLAAADLPVQTRAKRGFDHGVWTPLILIYPTAKIPVVQMSLQPSHGPDYQWRLGKLLAPLRSEGVLIIGSGAATHNLSAFAGYTTPPPQWVTTFDDWLATTIHNNDLASLLDISKI